MRAFACEDDGCKPAVLGHGLLLIIWFYALATVGVIKAIVAGQWGVDGARFALL